VLSGDLSRRAGSAKFQKIMFAHREQLNSIALVKTSGLSSWTIARYQADLGHLVMRYTNMSESEAGLCHEDTRLLQAALQVSVDLVQNERHLELAHHGVKLMLEPSGHHRTWDGWNGSGRRRESNYLAHVSCLI
jgi:hypothetical protein